MSTVTALAALTMRSRGMLATLRQRGGATRQVHGLFTDRVSPADAGRLSVASREASITLSALDAEGVLAGDQVDVGGAAYVVESQSGDANVRTIALAPA